MGQRSTLCTHQMYNLDSEPSDSCFQHDHNFFAGNVSDFGIRNSHHVISGPVNSVDFFHQFREYHDRVMMYGNQYSNIQSSHAIQNLGLGAVGPLNFCNTNVLLAPVGRNFPVHQSSVMTEHLPMPINQSDYQINMECFDSHNQPIDSNRGPCKRKDSELIPGICYNISGSGNSSSSTSYQPYNSGMPLWGQTCIMDPTSFTPLECGERTLSVAERSHRSSRNRSVSGTLQPESAVPQPQTCLLPGSYMSYPFQNASNSWVSQFGNGNNVVDGSFTWNYNNTLRHMQGRNLNSGPLHQANANMHAYISNSHGTSSAFPCHPSTIPNFHPTAHNVRVHGYNHHAQIPSPYQRPVNLCSINSNLSGDGMDVGCTIPHFIDEIYRPRDLPRPSQQLLGGSLRFLSAEDAAMVDLSGLYGAGSAVDQHEDLRLDIDDMSYEELLALEEQIGVVKTGLTEEFIMTHLKLRTHVPQETALSLEPSSRLAMENETCSICQVEYEDDEIIGALDCGHAYHGHCIKQWLLIKNLCPICKTSALVAEDRR